MTTGKAFVEGVVAGVVMIGVGTGATMAAAESADAPARAEAAAAASHPAADLAARQRIEENVMAIGRASGQVTAVQIKGSTWGTFVAQSGYAPQVPDPTAVAPLATPVYVEVIEGKMSFGEGTPAGPDPAQLPWMVSVLNAANDHSLFETSGNPGSAIPAWYTSMVDQSV